MKKVFAEKPGRDGRIDILGMDSCLMSMAEVCYQLRGLVSFMVGAEGYEPNTGWPYERILSPLFDDPGIDPEALAATIADEYVEYYKDYLATGRYVDQAACDLSRCGALADAVRLLAKHLTRLLSSPEGRKAILLAHWEAQTYKDDQYVDLYDFCDLLERGSNVLGDGLSDQAVRRACRKVKTALKEMVLVSRYSGPTVQYSHGLSIYFPWSEVSDTYQEFDFAYATGWYDFLQEYVSQTRRNPRTCHHPGSGALPQQVHLVYSHSAGSLGFLPVGNRDTRPFNRDPWPFNRLLGNKVVSMKNPPTSYYDCDCTRNRNGEGGAPKRIQP